MEQIPVFEIIGIPKPDKRPVTESVTLTRAIKKYFKAMHEARLPRSKSVPKLDLHIFDDSDGDDDNNFAAPSLRSPAFYIPSDYFTGWRIINLKNCGNVPKGLFSTKSENCLNKGHDDVDEK